MYFTVLVLTGRSPSGLMELEDRQALQYGKHTDREAPLGAADLPTSGSTA